MKQIVNKEEFFDLVWRLEEILMQADHLRNQIGKCGGSCDIEDDGLCPDCCTAFEKVMAEDERLAENGELDKVWKKLKRACDEDKTREYERILMQSRENKVVH